MPVAIALVLTGCSWLQRQPAPEESGPAAIEAQPVRVPGLGRDVGDLVLNSVHGEADGWVVVGGVTEPRERTRSVAFTSVDGADWRPDPLPAPDALWHDASEVVRTGGTWVIVGVANTGRTAHLVGWLGEPGDWRLVEFGDELGRHRGLTIADAAAAAGGAVVVGRVRGEDGRWTPRIWRIGEDGSAAEGAGPAELSGGGDEGNMNAVASDGDQLVAVATLGSPGSYRPPALFVSTDDGHSWTALPHSGLDRASVRGLAYISGTWWVAGSREMAAGEFALWRSVDASSWELSNDPEGWVGASAQVVVELGSDLLALGTAVTVAAGGGDWDHWWWPGPGGWAERGTLTAAAVHDGLLVAAARPRAGPDELYLTRQATDETWDAVRLADLVLTQTTGVWYRSAARLAASPDRLVIGGTQQVIGRLAGSFLVAWPELTEAGGAAAFPGTIVDVRYIDSMGFVAAGYQVTRDGPYQGAKVLQSADGLEWSTIGQTSGWADRALSVLEVENDTLVVGVTWIEDLPHVLLWRITDGELQPVEPEGLAGHGFAGGGCARGSTVAIQAFAGQSDGKLAVSLDQAATFTLVDDGPLTTAISLTCEVGPSGEIAVLPFGTPEPELHLFDPGSGSWQEVTLPEGDRVNLAEVLYLPELGWLLVGSDAREDETGGIAYVSRDLESWTAMRVTADRTGVRDAVVLGQALYLLGVENGDPALWTVPVELLAPTEP